MAKKLPKINIVQKSDSPVMKFVMIALLVILLAFAIVYIYNIQKFEKENFDNDGKKFQVVYVFSNSCGHCTRFSPTFDLFTKQFGDDSRFGVQKFEVSTPGAQPYKKDVDAFPTVLVYDAQGQKVFTAYSRHNQKLCFLS